MMQSDGLWEEDSGNAWISMDTPAPLAIGYRAGQAGMARLGVKRASDEEIVAIVETDACGVDAIQVLTGCTFGKGNFIYRDYGKHVFSLLSRASGKGVRLSMKPGVMVRPPRYRALSEKIRAGSATDEERRESGSSTERRSARYWNAPWRISFPSMKSR